MLFTKIGIYEQNNATTGRNIISMVIINSSKLDYRFIPPPFERYILSGAYMDPNAKINQHIPKCFKIGINLAFYLSISTLFGILYI